MSSGSEDDLSSGVGISTDLGSTVPTLTIGGTGSALDYGGDRDGLTSSAVVVEAGDQSTEDDVVIALPPTESDGAGEYHEIALTGSAALDLLDQMAANNAIGKEKAAKLRRKYSALRDTLESSRLMESNLLDKAKTLSHQLAYQRRVLEKGASFPDSSTTHSSHLRQILLSHQNEVDMCEMRFDKLNQEAEKLEVERSLVEKEYQRLPKKEELEQHIKELSKSVEGLNDEISLRTQDLERYHADLDKKNFRMTVIRSEIEELHQLEDALQQELIEIRNGPNITKDIEIIRRQHKETVQNTKQVEDYLDEITARVGVIGEDTAGMKEECTGTVALLHKQKEVAIEREMELNQLSKHLMLGKEREATLLEDKATLEIRQRHRHVEARALLEAHVAKMREKERELKSLKKFDLQLSSLRQSKEQVNRQVMVMEERKKKQIADCKKIAIARIEVQKEVDVLRKELQHIEGITDYDQVKLNQKVAVEEATKRCSRQLREKLHELNKDILAMTKARDNESRLYYKAKKEYRAIANDMQTKEAYIRDQQKKIRELDAELMDFIAAYEVVKNERNKTHSQILVMQQVSAELAEKSKILANEIEILHTISNEKDKILQKCSLVQSTKVLERDTQRQELTKLKMSQAEVQSELIGERESIIKLTRQISITEQLLNRLRRRYEQTVQERNDLGLQLIERNEEVCVFYEKLNVQESVIRTANLKLEAREEELKFLNAENGQLKSWDCTNVHDSVAVLIFNVTRSCFVLVRQFRPAVYMSRHKCLWENNEIFDETSLSLKPTTSVPKPSPPSVKGYGPGNLGCTYELCAGIIDKRVSLQQSAQEEILEETGYSISPESLECITSFYSSVGHAGSKQTLFYCEVSDMKASKGGGNFSEGEEIEVVHLPLKESLQLVFDQNISRTTGLLFALMWFEHCKRPFLNIN